MAKLQLPESQNIECKEIWKDEYLKWVCGCANASGGYIFIGVEDESCEIVGVDNSKRLLGGSGVIPWQSYPKMIDKR